mmetsp:Transcript_64546/g.167809  ORF Transcript_64546/g.167809 Transcript_64546/m.167809 type:complete len:188 (-) Transcript_64546:156-719(-)
MAIPMVGLAYWPLLLWLPTLAFQCLAATYFGRGAQKAVRGLTSILVDTPLGYFLKIVWVVMLVLCLECVRGVFMNRSSTGSSVGAGDAGTAANAAFEMYASKEGALVFGLNLVCMVAIPTIHALNGESIKLEGDRDNMKRQAEQQAEFTKGLLAADEKKADKAVPKESKMPEDKKESEADTEIRRRD